MNLPFAVAEYSAILPIKINQHLTSMVNLSWRGMDLAIQTIGEDADLVQYLGELERIMLHNFELMKWASGPGYYIKRGIYYQN